MRTDDLIDSLATDLVPVRRLQAPLRRTGLWLLISAPAVALVVASTGLRPDIFGRIADPLFAGQELMALATALIAGWAALSAAIPGAPRWRLAAPVVPLALWLATIGRQCWQEWIRFGADGMQFDPGIDCIVSILLVGTVPGLAMFALVRRGAAPSARAAVLWGAVAASALAVFGLRLFHPHDAALAVLLLQFGSVVVFSAAAAAARRWLVPG